MQKQSLPLPRIFEPDDDATDDSLTGIRIEYRRLRLGHGVVVVGDAPQLSNGS